MCAPALASPAIDDRGRPITPPTEEPRIAVLAPHLAELVHAAGAGDRLVAVSAYSDHPPGVERLPQIGDAFRVDLERLASIRPDIVFAWLGGNPAAMIAEVERLGYPVAAFQAGQLDDIARHIRVIGRLAGTEHAAERAATRYEDRLEALRTRFADATPVRVFYQVSERPLFTFGGTHPVSSAIALCGGVNVFGDLAAPAPTVSVEAVLAASPEVIFTGVWREGAPDPGELSSWARWTRVPAVRDGHLYQLDATLMGRSTPRMLDEVERMCGRIERARRR